MAFNIAPFIPPVIFAVTIAFLGYFYGILVGLFFLFVSGYAFFFLGLGKIRTPVSSVEVRPAKPGQGAPRRKAGWEHKELMREPFPGVATLYDVFQRGLRVNPDGKCYGYRPAPDADFKWLTYKEVDKRIKSHTAALISIGMEEQERLGFYTKNRIEWGILAEAANACNLVSVAIYDTLGEENRVFVVQQSQIKTILTSRQLLDNICSLAGECPELKNVILAGECEQVDRDKAEAAGLKLYTFEEFEELGARSPHKLRLPKPEDLAIIMYTSGTTSRPKGVMLSHSNVVGTVAGVLETVNFNETDRYLSYLPLAHILERAAECCVLVGGGATGFYQGDIRKLDADIKAVKPTIYCGVPKVFQRVMNTVLRKIHESPLYAQILFNTAYCIKRKFIETGLPTGLLDKIIFNKVKEGLGGEVRLLVSGGAPLAGECHEFLRVCFGCPVRQGYGLTETSGGATVVPAESVEPWEKAGCPMSACEIKLVDSGNYSSRHNPPQGEICVRGPNVTLGYYEMQDKTDEVFITEEDGERWFHTGDVGQWNPDGTLSIIGRTKDIFKLDGGEYIAPERLETKFAQCKLISNIFVYGDSKKSCLVAVVVPEFQAALAWAKANNVEVKDHFEPPNCPPSLCKNEDLKKQIQKDLDAMAAECKLQRYEYIVRLHLDAQFWTPETGLVTSALKNKRPQLFEHYERQINEMYASVKE